MDDEMKRLTERVAALEKLINHLTTHIGTYYCPEGGSILVTCVEDSCKMYTRGW